MGWPEVVHHGVIAICIASVVIVLIRAIAGD